MEEQRLDYLKQHYAYDVWCGNNTLDENLFVWKFMLSGNKFRDWRCRRIQRTEVSAAPASADVPLAVPQGPLSGKSLSLIRQVWERPEGQTQAPYRIRYTEVPATPVSADALTGQGLSPQEYPVLTQSFWEHAEVRTEALLNMNIFECSSRMATHELLLRLLGEFQLPGIARREDIMIGDVAFASPGDTIILFARANLVILIRNAGRDIVPVSDIASQFDRDLISKPEAVGAKAVPEIRRFEAPVTELRLQDRTSLAVEAADPLQRPVWYKVFSRGGEVLQEKGRLVYQPASTGMHDVTIFAVSDNRDATSQNLKLAVK